MGREWGGDEKGEISLRVTWGQGGRDRITPKEGFQVGKKEWKGKQQGISKGSKKQGDCAIIMLSICIHVYNNCLNAECS
jgi:hypothetical protein